nr:MAG TPA: L-lysine 2,3-aminomutase [Caudoviricetes sp.]
MNIGLIDVDGHNFPSFALMRISAYHKARGDQVEWATPFNRYDKVMASKVFTFTPDFNYLTLQTDIVEKGGTGYDITSRLPEEIENSRLMDCSIYPQYSFSLQFFSRGCIRKCPFCLVREKEGYIQAVEPVELNPEGKWIEVLDNNFFANPEWRNAISYLLKQNQMVNLHGVDVRIMNEEQAFYLSKLRLKRRIHIAWDLPSIDLTDKLREVTKYIKPRNLSCYVLVGYNSTVEQDMYRLSRLRELGISPFVQPYRDFDNDRKVTLYEKDLAQWANKHQIFKACEFKDFSPRKGFKCEYYLKQ